MQNHLILNVLPLIPDDFAFGSREMTVYGNYDVIAFKSCIQIFTVHCTVSKYYIHDKFRSPYLSYLRSKADSF